MATRLNTRTRTIFHPKVRLEKNYPLIGNKDWAIIILTTLWLTPQGRDFGVVTAGVLKDIAYTGYKEVQKHLKESPYFQSFFFTKS